MKVRAGSQRAGGAMSAATLAKSGSSLSHTTQQLLMGIDPRKNGSFTLTQNLKMNTHSSFTDNYHTLQWLHKMTVIQWISNH